MQLPEKFLKSTSAAVQTYIKVRYSQYGYPRKKFIEYNPEFIPEGQSKFSSDRFRWVEQPDNRHASNGLRFVGKSSDIIRLDYTGWYVDNGNNETQHGVVYQLPARDGVPQYVPGISDPYGNDGVLLCFTDVTEDKEDAARWADSHAKRFAEDAREAEAKEDAERRIEEIADEITQAYKDFRKVSKTLRQLPKQDAKELIAREWHSTRATIEELRNEKRKIEREGYYY